LFSNAVLYVYPATDIYEYSDVNVSMFVCVCVCVCIIHGTIVIISTSTSSCVLCVLHSRFLRLKDDCTIWPLQTDAYNWFNFSMLTSSIGSIAICVR